MSRLESDVLFNRALLWLLLAYVTRNHADDGSEWFSWVYVVISLHCVWKSFKAFGD